jgi:hypothetical protein
MKKDAAWGYREAAHVLEQDRRAYAAAAAAAADARRAAGAADTLHLEAEAVAALEAEAVRLEARAAAALEVFRTAHGKALAEHRAYWSARREAMLINAVGSAIYLRDFERICAAAGEPPPDFFKHEGTGPVQTDGVPIAPPAGIDGAP